MSWIERRGHVGRGTAIAAAYLIVAIAVAAIGLTFVPKLVSEVNGFVQHLPNYAHDLTHGRGRLGFLERKYHVVEKVRHAVQNGGASRLLGLSGTAVAITKSVLTIIAATVTIVFLTFFMLLEGRRWVEHFYDLLPEKSRPRWRKVGHDIYRTVGGYVTGNLLISVIAGVSATVVLLVMGVPYAVALGLLVAILDLIPLAGATLAGIAVVGISFHSIPAGIVVLVFIVVYQQIENHFLQPVIYGRTVQLSPLTVLIRGPRRGRTWPASSAHWRRFPSPARSRSCSATCSRIGGRRAPGVEPGTRRSRGRDRSGEQPRRHPVAEEATAPRERERSRCSLGQPEQLEACDALRVDRAFEPHQNERFVEPEAKHDPLRLASRACEFLVLASRSVACLERLDVAAERGAHSASADSRLC